MTPRSNTEGGLSELVYAGGKVVGTLEDGVFTQTITERHIFRRYNAKGMDKAVYLSLEGRCDRWRLLFKKTGRVLSIPFAKIAEVGFEADTHTGYGLQVFVKLNEFNEERPPIQGTLL